MPEELSQLDIRTREQWRQWLSEHHASSPGVWLVRHKQHTGVESLPYEDLVREALCFGWIDSLVKRLDDDRYATKVTPRKPTSVWSDLNRRRWRELEAAGRLAPAGLDAAPTENGYPARPTIPELPDYIADAFRADPEAWRHFEALPRTSRRDLENPHIRTEDVSAVVDHLTTLDYVDGGRIGAMGICAGAGYTVSAAIDDPRIRAVGTVSMVNIGQMFRNGWTNDIADADAAPVLTMGVDARTADAAGQDNPFPLAPMKEEDAPNEELRQA